MLRAPLTTVLALAAALLAAGPALAGKSAGVALDSGGVQVPRVSGAHRAELRDFLVPASGVAHNDRLSDVVAQCAADGGTSALLPVRVASITASPGGAILVAGEPAGSVAADGTLPEEDLRGQLITPLYDVLLMVSEDSRLLSARGCELGGGQTRGNIVLVLDERLPFETVRAILYTAGQAQFGEFHLVVDDPGADPAPHATTRPEPGPVDVVIQGPWGYDVRPADGEVSAEPVRLECAVQPCVADGWPLGELQAALADLHAATPEVEELVLVPDASVPYAALTATLAAVDQGASRGAYSHVVIAGGTRGDPDLPTLSPAPPPGKRKVPRQTWTDSVPTLRFALPMIGRRHADTERQIQENGGVLGVFRDGDTTDLIGGLIGAKGVQVGSGGLGSRGTGLGGGGDAEGLGGLGTRDVMVRESSGGIGAAGGDPIILGALDRSLIDAVVKRHMNQIRYCYHRELTNNPQIAGKLVIKFVIAKDGSVSNSNVKTTTLDSPAVETCVAARFMRMQFPEPKGGGIVIVSYPFVFSSTEEEGG